MKKFDMSLIVPKRIEHNDEKFSLVSTHLKNIDAQHALNRIKHDGYLGRIYFNKNKFHVYKSMNKRRRIGISRNIYERRE